MLNTNEKDDNNDTTAITSSQFNAPCFIDAKTTVVWLYSCQWWHTMLISVSMHCSLSVTTHGNIILLICITQDIMGTVVSKQSIIITIDIFVLVRCLGSVWRGSRVSDLLYIITVNRRCPCDSSLRAAAPPSSPSTKQFYNLVSGCLFHTLRHTPARLTL